MTAPAAPLLLGVLLAWALAGVASRVTARHAVRARLPTNERPRRTVRPRRPGRRSRVAVIGVVVGAAIAAAGPVLGTAVAAAAVAPLVLRRQRRPGAALAAAVATLPDTVDLLGVAARAGLPAPAAVGAIVERAPPPWGAPLVAVLARTTRGERFGDALDELVDVGGPTDVGHPLRAVLRSAVDDGSDLVAGLERLAVDARDLRRRRAEEAARRVPVRLLLPLVACSLPAFALLTIVPIVAGALRALAS